MLTPMSWGRGQCCCEPRCVCPTQPNHVVGLSAWHSLLFAQNMDVAIRWWQVRRGHPGSCSFESVCVCVCPLPSGVLADCAARPARGPLCDVFSALWRARRWRWRRLTGSVGGRRPAALMPTTSSSQRSPFRPARWIAQVLWATGLLTARCIHTYA